MVTHSHSSSVCLLPRPHIVHMLTARPAHTVINLGRLPKISVNRKLVYMSIWGGGGDKMESNKKQFEKSSYIPISVLL